MEKTDFKRWLEVYHYGFGYTKCPYCGDETIMYNPFLSNPTYTELENNRRKHCLKCGNRVYGKSGLILNQPEDDLKGE